MRLDPDIIMIGEIRDRPSARLAVQAAMTGHQVWSTVHANHALAIIDRLIDLEVPQLFVYDPSIVSGLICQRLLKLLCPNCKQPLIKVMNRYPRTEVQRIASVLPLDNVYVRGDGCSECRQSGISGRTAVAELIVTDETLMSLLRKNDCIEAWRYWRHELRGTTLIQNAIDKIAAGRVDPFQAEEVVGLLDVGKRELDSRTMPSKQLTVVDNASA